MKHRTVLWRAVPYYEALNRIIKHRTVLLSTVPYYEAPYRIIKHCTVLWSTEPYYEALYRIMKHRTVLWSTVPKFPKFEEYDNKLQWGKPTTDQIQTGFFSSASETHFVCFIDTLKWGRAGRVS
jgi:hypothetical protein